MRASLVVLAALLIASPTGHAVVAQPKCSKADFESVVDEAGDALRALAQQNTPPFQAKLRQLKTKRGWSDEQFLAEAEPLVRDETIAGFDRQAEGLVSRITSAGQSGTA